VLKRRDGSLLLTSTAAHVARHCRAAHFPFGAELCQTRITETVSIAESPALGKDIFSHAPDSRGAQDSRGAAGGLLSSGFLEALGAPVAAATC